MLWIYFGESFFFFLSYKITLQYFLRDWLNYLHFAGDNNKMVELPVQSP